jgi:hypothetical protein
LILRIFTPALLLFLSQKVLSQSVSTSMGGRAIGIAYASSTLNDEWSLFNNTGGLARIKKISASASYEINPSLAGANRTAAVLNTPTQLGTAAIGFFRFGDELYSEQVISGGFGNQLGIASIGLKVNYIQYRAEGFGIKKAVSVNFGGIAEITPSLTIGAYITNINQPKISRQGNERIPAKLTTGISFKSSDRVRLFAEIEKDIEYDPTLKGAFEYVIYKKLFVRTGFNLQPNAGFFGLGFLSRRLKIDYGMQYVSSLHLIHQASATYQFTKKRNEKQ